MLTKERQCFSNKVATRSKRKPPSFDREIVVGRLSTKLRTFREANREEQSFSSNTGPYKCRVADRCLFLCQIARYHLSDILCY